MAGDKPNERVVEVAANGSGGTNFGFRSILVSMILVAAFGMAAYLGTSPPRKMRRHGRIVASGSCGSLVFGRIRAVGRSIRG